MSLTEASLYEITKKQYLFKLKAYLNLFYGLIAAHILALLFSLNATSGTGTGTGNIHFYLHRYSVDVVIVFIIIWVFINSIMFTQNSYKNIDFTYVSNRMSSNLSSVCFLITAAVVSSLAAVLSGAVLRVLMYFLPGRGSIIDNYFFIPPKDLLLSFLAAFLYMLVLSSLGYLIGMIMRLGKIFVVLLPTLFIASIYFENLGQRQIRVVTKTIYFFTSENSLLIFSVKALAVSTVLFVIGIILSNRSEVR